MATATLVIVILCAAGLAWLIRRESFQIQCRCESARQENLATRELIADAHGDLLTIRDVLTEASRIKAKKQDSVFDRDTITPTNQKPRYVSLAIRRAQAERASLGPVTHDDRVRENNARAMEQA